MTFGIRRLALALALFASLLAAELKATSAETPGRGTLQAADVRAGKLVAETCVACHGPQGISGNPEVPHLAGQHADYLVRALKAYRGGQRRSETMEAMIKVVAALGEEDMVNVAVYLASLEPFAQAAEPVRKDATTTEATPEAVQADPFAAAKAAAEACAECHGEDGNINSPGMPSLAGQHAEYLVAALNAYKDGSRADDAMRASAESLSDAEIENIAAYYSEIAPNQTQVPVAGDPDAGRVPAAACAICHGEDGNIRDPATPRLAGLDALYLAAAIKAYQAGTREHTVMQDLVKTLEEDEVENLAAFYATQEPKFPRKPLTIEEWAQRCDRCHGPDGHSTDRRFPILAGQSKQYLAEALKFYHGGLRASSMMYAMSFQMTEDDIEELAAYYAGKTVK